MEDVQPIALAALSHTPSQSQPDPAAPAAQPQHALQHGLPQHAQHYPTPISLDQPQPTFDSSAATAATSSVVAAPVTHGTLVRLHALFSQQHDTKLRHLAFMLLSRLGGLPPTLYRPSEDPEPAGAQGTLPLHSINAGTASQKWLCKSFAGS